VIGAEASRIFVLMPKCPWTDLKDASSVVIVLRNVNPLYICYFNGMEVLGKRLTKAVSEAIFCV